MHKSESGNTDPQQKTCDMGSHGANQTLEESIAGIFELSIALREEIIDRRIWRRQEQSDLGAQKKFVDNLNHQIRSNLIADTTREALQVAIEKMREAETIVVERDALLQTNIGQKLQGFRQFVLDLFHNSEEPDVQEKIGAINKIGLQSTAWEITRAIRGVQELLKKFCKFQGLTDCVPKVFEDTKDILPVKIRPMEQDDAFSVSRIELVTFEFPFGLAEFEKRLSIKEGENESYSEVIGDLVALDGDKIVAAAIINREKSVDVLRSIAVDPDFRHRGIGSQLIEREKSDLKRGQSSIELDVRERNLPAQMFFRFHDFLRTRTVNHPYDNTPEDAYHMSFTKPKKRLRRKRKIEGRKRKTTMKPA